MFPHLYWAEGSCSRMLHILFALARTYIYINGFDLVTRDSTDKVG